MLKSIASSRKSSASRPAALLGVAVLLAVGLLGSGAARRGVELPRLSQRHRLLRVHQGRRCRSTAPARCRGRSICSRSTSTDRESRGARPCSCWPAGRGRRWRRSASTSMFEFGNALGNKDLVLFDQRGTGRSGVLRCPGLEGRQIGNVDAAVKACANAIGPRRRFYTTWDSAQDIEAVRRALGIGKITLIGVSYGTKLAADLRAALPVERRAAGARLGRQRRRARPACSVRRWPRSRAC